MVTSHQEESIQNEKGPRDGEPEPGTCVPPSAHLSFASVNGSACVCAFGGGGEGGLGGVVGLVRGGSAGLRWRRATRYFQGRATQEVSLARPPLPHWLDLLRQNSRTLRPPNPPTPQLHPSSYLVHAHQTRPSPGRGAASGPGSAAVLIDFAVALRVRAADLGSAVHHTPSRSRLQPAGLHPPSPCRDVAPLDLSLRRWLGVTRSHSGSSPEWKNPGA